MIQIRSNCLIFLVVLLCASMIGAQEQREMAELVVLSQLVDPVTGEVNEDMAKLIWNSCWLDLIDLKESNEDLDLRFTEETSAVASNSMARSLTKEKVWKSIRIQHPLLKQTILNCVRKNNFLFHIRQEGRSNNQQGRYLDSLFPTAVVPRRNLLQSVSETPDSELSLHAPFSPQIDDETATARSTLENSDAEPNRNAEIISAVVVTAVVTLAFTGLFFYCWTKISDKNSKLEENDDEPLSLRDYCTGPYKEGKSGHLSLNDNSSHHKKNSSMNSTNSDAFHVSVDNSSFLAAVSAASEFSAEAIDRTEDGNGLLPPPPGRMDGIPPLKPPPGRVVPVTSEPPTNLPVKGDLPSSPPPGPPRAPSPPAKASSPVSPCSPSPPPPPMAPGAKPGSPPPPPPGADPAPPPPGAGPAPPPPPAAGPALPPPPGAGPAPPPPPPLRGGRAPPPPPGGAKIPRSHGSKFPSKEASGEGDADANNPKTKLKPFFWDKVQATSRHSMVWHQLTAGSFQFNEEVIETLFGYAAAADKNNQEGKKGSQDPSSQFIHILDTKKAQNLSILLRALGVTIEEVSDALHKGNELPAELLQTLLKMTPSPDEELKLRLFSGELSQLGTAERFLKVLVDIPFAYKRLEALLLMGTLHEEVTSTKQSFATLEVACKELRNSRLFLKILEAVLKTGNRMNVGTFRGGAKAFKLDTLLKLADVKGTDGKTTLLHFVVQEIIRSEGMRAARAARESRTLSNISVSSEDLLEENSPEIEEDYRNVGLQVVSHLSSELENVKQAAVVDADCLTGTVAKLGHSLLKSKEFLEKDLTTSEEDCEFHVTLKCFMQTAEVDVMSLLEEEKRIMALVKSTGDYFHGNAKKDEGLRLFTIVRDFLIILDKVCKQVGEAQKKAAKSLSHSSPHHVRSQLFPASAEGRDDLSSDDGS